MHHPTDRITHTMTFVTPVMEHWLEREIAQWVHSMKDRSDDPLSKCSYHRATFIVRSINYSYSIKEMSRVQKLGLITCVPKQDKPKQILF